MVNCINLIIEMSPRFVLGQENVPCVAEVVNGSLKADCTDSTSIISLLMKPFYLLSPQNFSFQIVSEFIDMFVKFSNFMSRGWGFDPLFCPEGRVFVHNDCPGGRAFAPFKSCPGDLSRGGDG